MLVAGGIRVVGVVAEFAEVFVGHGRLFHKSQHLGLGITLALMSVSLLENGLY